MSKSINMAFDNLLGSTISCMHRWMEGWMWCKHVHTEACINIYMLVSHSSIHACVCVCIYVWTYQSLVFPTDIPQMSKAYVDLIHYSTIECKHASIHIYQNPIFPNDILQNNYLSLCIELVSFLNFRIVYCDWWNWLVLCIIFLFTIIWYI